MRADAVAVRRLMLAAMPANITGMMVVTDCTRPAIAAHVRALQADQQCHVGDWRATNGKGMLAAIYHAGPGEDVPSPRPPPKPREPWVHTIPPRDAITAALFGPRP